MKRRIGTCMLALALIVAATGSASAGAATWGTDNQHQLVPAYFYPNWWNTSNDWYRMCDAMNTTGGASTAVMNPDGGPGAGANPDYAQALAHCHAVGQRVVGYVHTSYGSRPLADVGADIDAFYASYPGIDGILVDEMSTDPATRSYYESIYARVHAEPGVHQVVGNPGGTPSTAWQLTAPVADILVVFEGTGSQYLDWTPPAWLGGVAAGQISHLVYSTPSEVTMQQVCARSKTLNAGNMYVTGDGLPNPWDTLPAPTYWTSSVAACR
jgi:hypothetical protein